MAFVRVNDVVLHYEDSGDRHAPAIVFSNSLGTDFRIWDGLVCRLGEGYRILRYDKRGHGLSEAPPAPYAMTDHVGDVAALMDHCGVTGTTVVGLSVGGMIAQGLAALRPDLVSALVLSNTAHKIGTSEMWNERIDGVATRGIGSLADGIMERWFTPQYRVPDNPDFTGYLAMLTRTTLEGYAGTCAAIRDCDLTESTRALTVPTLCIVGDQDGSTPPDLVRSMADLIEASQFEIIEGAGHLPCVEQPEKTASVIRDFLADAGKHH